eukprot:TRINITY_DN76561_c0_g1_i1.p1 TRINITY_DN76561_c0_g1~~TRINITY_DN76561_c0_g1_i1.p1  ORF type:complete len:839 (-),score=92.41 TRINITY_DN76561_c0_g1_i1:52-2568(-)
MGSKCENGSDSVFHKCINRLTAEYEFVVHENDTLRGLLGEAAPGIQLAPAFQDGELWSPSLFEEIFRAEAPACPPPWSGQTPAASSEATVKDHSLEPTAVNGAESSLDQGMCSTTGTITLSERPPEMTLRMQMWNFFDYGYEHKVGVAFYSKVYHGIYRLLILLAVFVPIFMDPAARGESEALYVMDVVFNTFITIDTSLKLFCCPSICHYLRDWHTIVDISVIAAGWLLTFAGDSDRSVASAIGFVRCQLPVLRFLKLTRHSRDWRLLTLAMRNCLEPLGVPVYFMVLMIVFFGSTLYWVEKHLICFDAGCRESTEMAFESIPHAMWFVIVSVSTAGYGDVYPASDTGKMVGAMMFVSGICYMAMPLAIVGCSFADVWKRKHICMLQHRLFRRAHHREDVIKLFSEIDADEDGMVTQAELEAAVDYLNLGFSKRTCRQLFKHLDIDGTGQISCTEFMDFMYPDRIRTSVNKRSLSMDSISDKLPEITFTKHGVWVFLEHPTDEGANWVFHRVYDALILLSVLVPIVNTMDISEDARAALIACEIFFTILFTLEISVKLYCCPSKRRYLLSIYTAVDIAVALTSWVLMFTKQGSLGNMFIELIAILAPDIRLLKLSRHSVVSRLLVRALIECCYVLVIPLYFAMVIILVFGSLLYWVDAAFACSGDACEKNAGPAFTSIPHGMWLVVCSISTVGYGDVVPHSAFGKMICSVSILVGVCYMAMPLTIVGNSFMETWNGRHRLLLQDKLARHVHMSPGELAELWATLDKDGSGTITDVEFVEFIQSLGLGFGKRVIYDVFKYLDADESRHICLDEFLDFLFPDRHRTPNSDTSADEGFGT